ncbi:MAG: efflux transporter outer membrane subunit [Sphingomonas sp.]|uniref:efflux transporter outer membrane subunit n=1 Tax=Sphingomonas sp. TaxID=28214 RepID=UPI0022748C33|nr:efflux transporter outer membrane subunit [Sphingomonas sp.]MCX8475365.1 efflux transporter outer membrane subunit [Sphingomonas sp.]
MVPSRVLGTIGTLLLLGGCAMHPGAPPATVRTPPRWENGAAPVSASATIEERWWSRLGDPVIDQLIDAALSDNPTLAEALARVDQARATLDAGRAARLPRADVSGAASYGQQNLGTAGGVNTVGAATASISPSLSWELDLWGRVRKTARAAQSRLDARDADARDARLSIAAQLAAGVLRLRACNYSLGARRADIASRSTELELMRTRLSFGAVAPVDVASARSNLASAEIDRISQQEQCTREVDALVAISGVDAATIRALLPDPSASDGGSTIVPQEEGEGDLAGIIPAAPPMRPVLPATVLLHHPSVVAAEREANARWSEIGVAQAERMPRIDLVAILTGQWLRALGTTSSFATWSAGPQLSGTVFDGGAGAANVRNAEARYREAVATLEGAVRTAVQGIEDGLAAQQSAEQRLARSREALTAARLALNANQARWRAGAIDLFELEASRRQFNQAQESAIAAARDHAEAWVELVRASGNAFDLASAVPDGQPPLALSAALANHPQ